MTTRPTDTGTRVAAVAPGVLLLAALAVAGPTIGPTLPERIAIHFGGDGTPNGWGSPWPIFAVAAVLAAGAVALGAAVPRLRDRRTAATLLAVTVLLASVISCVWVLLALANTSDAPRAPWWWTLVLLAVGAVAAGVPLVALWRTAPPVPRRAVDPLALPPQARVAWRARTGSTLLTAVGVAVVAVGAGAALTVGLGTGSAGSTVVAVLCTVAVGVAVLSLARVEVTVDRRGLRLTSTITRLPLMRVPLDRIRSAGYEDVSPGQWGGWGYRITGRGIAYVARSGPGLLVELDGGGARLVTVPDAERGAAALGALLSTRSS